MTTTVKFLIFVAFIIILCLVFTLSTNEKYTAKRTNDLVLPEFTNLDTSSSGFLTLKETNKLMTRRMEALSGKYMSKDKFNKIFSVVIPSYSSEANIFLWQLQMMVKLQMHDFLHSLTKTGGKFYVDKKTIVDVSEVLSDLLFYIPDGLWSHDFILLLSIFNRIKTDQKSSNKENDGFFLPVLNMIDFSYLITGILQPSVSDGIDHHVKLAWNSGWTTENYRNKKLDNAYGETVSIPWNVLSETDDFGYKAYMYNDLANQALNHFNPVTRPYDTNDLDENMFYDQTIALRRQDFTRRLNSEKQGLFSPESCVDILNAFAEDNDGSMDGFSGFLTRVREELFDCAESRRNPQLAGWYFYIRYISNRQLPLDNGFPSVVEDNKISSRNLMEIKRLEGSVKPVENPDDTVSFGSCRPVLKCRSCRSSCRYANCNKLRAHAAVDFYGSTNAAVRSTYYGISIGVSRTFFADRCSVGGIGDASCPPGYSCQSSYCKTPSGNKNYYPAVTIKHVDGTLARYGEFPLESGTSTGSEFMIQQKIGKIVIYTRQCHFETYSGEVDIIPWISGGNPYDDTNPDLDSISDMKTNFLSKLSVTQTPPRFVATNALDYKYVPTPNYCIPGCNYNCKYNRRCDLLNSDPVIGWNSTAPFPPERCRNLTMTGRCIDVSKCPGTPVSGLCSGGSNIMCCPDDEKGV